MNRTTLRLLQRRLAAAGLYDAAIDGVAGPATDAGVAQALADRADKLPDGWQEWPDSRKRVACLQLFATEAGFDAGPIDGLWGPQTAYAADALDTLDRTGRPPDAWRDRLDQPVGNPNGWPASDDASLTQHFGAYGVRNGREPRMVFVDCPWTLRLAWDTTQRTRRIRCHALIAESLSRVLDRVHDTYGERDLSRLRLDLFGGCYAPRAMRRGTRQSTHSWAIALDWDPTQNQLDWNRKRARLARPEYDAWWDAWEAEGWHSLGRRRNFDWMHIQATR